MPDLATIYEVLTQPADASVPLIEVPTGYMARLRAVTVDAQYQTVGGDGVVNPLVSFIGPAIVVENPIGTSFIVPSGFQVSNLGLWGNTAAGDFEQVETWWLGAGDVQASQVPFAEVTLPGISSSLPDVWLFPTWKVFVRGQLQSPAVGIVELLQVDESSSQQTGSSDGLQTARLPFYLSLVGGGS